MDTNVTDNKVYKEILLLKKIVLAMKEDMEDRFLTAEEEMELEKAREEFKRGECVSLDNLRKELNV